MSTGRPNSRCPSDEDLSAYVDGELAGEAWSGIAGHLETCSRCRKQAQELGRTSAGLRRVFQRAGDEVPVPDPLAGLAAVGASRRWLPVALAAAAVVVAVVALYPFLLSGGGESVVGPPARTAEEVSSSQDERVVLFDPLATPPGPATLSMALAGNVRAELQLCRLGFRTDLPSSEAEPASPAVDAAAAELEAIRRWLCELSQQSRGDERWDEHRNDDSSGLRPLWPYWHLASSEHAPRPSGVAGPSRTSCSTIT